MTPLQEAAANLHRAAIGAQKRRQIDALARRHQRRISAFFRKQKAMVLNELSQRQYLFTESYRQLSEETTQLTLQNWDRIWENISNDSLKDLQKVIFDAEAEGVIRGSEQLKKITPFFDKKSSFNLANPRSVRWFQQKGGSIDYIKGIQKTTGDSLKRVIATALDEGWSYTSTAREIQKLYDEPISRDRAQRIAVYETGSAYEQGNKLFAESLVDDGVEMEEMWMSSHDSKVRPEHDEISGNESEGWVPMGHVFSSGHTAPPTDPGCRCYMIYRQKPAK